jgi:hypothetical protein
VEDADGRYFSSGSSIADLESELDNEFQGNKELIADFIKSFLVYRQYKADLPTSEVAEEDSFQVPFDMSTALSMANNFNSICKELGIQDCKLLGRGGFGEVHEV